MPSPDDLSWLGSLASRFIVFDGPDGSGKSTQFRRFVAACQLARVPLCDVREPGGTPIGERIRDILLDHAHKDMSLRCEMLLYMASRAQLFEQRIRPALDAGMLVLADRFVSSTIAYQGAAGGLPIDDILAVARIATGGDRPPDLVVIFDIDEETAARRLSPLVGGGEGGGLDRVEAKGREFHRRVREGYLRQVRDDPQRIRRIDASLPEEQVWRQLLATIRHALA